MLEIDINIEAGNCYSTFHIPSHVQSLMALINLLGFTGLQLILPDYLRESFVQAALSYIACNGEGEFGCKDNDCWCNCDAKFPECNCPYMDVQAMEESLERISETWGILYKEFEESGNKVQLKVIDSFFLSSCMAHLNAGKSNFLNVNHSYERE